MAKIPARIKNAPLKRIVSLSQRAVTPARMRQWATEQVIHLAYGETEGFWIHYGTKVLQGVLYGVGYEVSVVPHPTGAVLKSARALSLRQFAKIDMTKSCRMTKNDVIKLLTLGNITGRDTNTLPNSWSIDLGASTLIQVDKVITLNGKDVVYEVLATATS